jgi:CubicO group peptidase (beta-lactamase class C family)
MANFDRVTSLMESFTVNGPPGCACLVSKQGEILYEHYTGYADLDAKTLIASDTIYRIYSMSKVVTCVAALMLYERGLYLLNDPLEEYLPEFKKMEVYRTSPEGAMYTSPAAGSIRIKDLFTMSSGITYPGGDNETQRHTARVMDELERRLATGEQLPSIRVFTEAIASVPLAFDPGTHWHYGFSHDVLGVLIEVISGKRFSQFLDEEIFQPLGMKDTFFRIPDEKRSRLCTMYDHAADGVLTKNDSRDRDYQPDAQFESGGAGLLSTLEDYGRFAQMLALGGTVGETRILGRKTIELMATQHLSPLQQKDYNWGWQVGYGYGLGVRVMEDRAAGGSNSPAGEFGWSGLAGSWVSIDMQEGVSAVYMQQMLPSDEHVYQPRLRSAIYGSL